LRERLPLPQHSFQESWRKSLFAHEQSGFHV
jgi:hypothetical protein